MKTPKSGAAAFVAALIVSSQAMALDAESVKAYCDEVSKAAVTAKSNYLATYQPKQDPGKVFENAINSCLDQISKYSVGFNFSSPNMAAIQKMMEQMAAQLIQKACQSAQDQFNKAVNEAKQTVNGTLSPVNDVPLVNANMTSSTSGTGGVSTNVTNTSQSTVNSTSNSWTNRVFNYFK